MSAMDEAFGPMRERPDTPDFWRLSEIILENDGAMEAAADQDAKDEVFSSKIDSQVDVESLTYVAMQRAFRAMGITTRYHLLQDHATVQRAIQLASLFLDGFLVGCQFKERDGK